MPAISAKNVMTSAAVQDLGLGDSLKQQLADEEEMRRKKALQMQQQMQQQAAMQGFGGAIGEATRTLFPNVY